MHIASRNIRVKTDKGQKQHTNFVIDQSDRESVMKFRYAKGDTGELDTVEIIATEGNSEGSSYSQ